MFVPSFSLMGAAIIGACGMTMEAPKAYLRYAMTEKDTAAAAHLQATFVRSQAAIGQLRATVANHHRAKSWLLLPIY